MQLLVAVQRRAVIQKMQLITWQGNIARKIELSYTKFFPFCSNIFCFLPFLAENQGEATSEYTKMKFSTINKGEKRRYAFDICTNAERYLLYNRILFRDAFWIICTRVYASVAPKNCLKGRKGRNEKENKNGFQMGSVLALR